MSDCSINWFEIPVTNPTAAATFYAKVLGRNLDEMDGPDGTMLVFLDENGPCGTLLSAQADNQPSPHGTRVYFNCPDIDAAISRVVAAGGTVELVKTSIGPHGYIGKFADPDGNLVGLHHPN